jgi:transcriptional regulator with XRE-family HTH domain
MFGQKIRKLREARGIFQRQVAAILDVDIAYISKMESEDKPVSKAHISKLALLYGVQEDELYTLWLAEKVYEVVKNHDFALEAIEVAEAEIKSERKQKRS